MDISQPRSLYRCHIELKHEEFFRTCESREVRCVGEGGLGNKKPLHCAGAEEEINRRCHIYYTIVISVILVMSRI